MMVMSMVYLVDHMVGICQIARNFLELGIPEYLRWVSLAGIVEEVEGGGSEYKVRVERDCQLLV